MQMEKNKKIFFENITIACKNIIPLDAVYLHELIHALVVKDITCITDYLDDEFLSVLLEKIFLHEYYGEATTKASIYNRWVSINLNFDNMYDYENYNTTQSYYKSQVLSIYLYEQYKKMTNYEKKIIFKNIKDILEGNIKIHEFLEIYGLHLRKSEVCNVAIENLQKNKNLDKRILNNEIKKEKQKRREKILKK